MREHASLQYVAPVFQDFFVKLRSMPYGTEFYIRDPDGYILGFIQPSDSP